MNRLYIISFLLCSTFFTSLKADVEINKFTYLRSEGVIPTELQKILSQDNDDANFIKNLIKTGRLIYGTELNKYVETIADNILVKEPELRKQLSIYIVRSAAVNAMVSKQGIVLVNIGLLAELTNESELAFILGHEISHYLDKKDTKLKKTSITSLNSYLNYHQNSRDEELSADKFSLEQYIKNSPYSASALENIFDVFRYSYLPFNEIPFTRSEVETDFYTFPENYFLANVNEIRSRTDYVDTLSTHPNLKRRQLQLDQFLEINPGNGSQFVQSEEKFSRIRNLARLECINFFLTWHDYGNAIINIIALKKMVGQNHFLDIAEASAYYGFHKHKLTGNVDNVVQAYKMIEGEKQQVCYFLRKLTKKEANVLAIRKLVTACNKYPENTFLHQMAADAVYDLKKECKMSIVDFSDYAQNTNPDSITDEVTKDLEVEEQTDKYSRIKEKKETGQFILSNKKFETVNYMLVDLKRNNLFMSLYNDALAKIEDEEALAIANIENPIFQSNDKVLIWMPTYARINEKTNQTTYSERNNNKLKKAIKKSTKSLKIDAQIYDENFKHLTTDQINRISLVGQWYLEYQQINFNRMVLYQQPNLHLEFANSGLRYINLVNEGSENTSFFSPGYKWSILYRAPISFATVPLDLLIFALPNQEKTLYFNLYDMENGITVFSKNYKSMNIDADAYINNKIYSYYYDLKKGIKLK